LAGEQAVAHKQGDVNFDRQPALDGLPGHQEVAFRRSNSLSSIRSIVMKCCRLLLAALLPIAFAIPVQAGLFSFGKPKGNPAERVAQLIVTVKTDSDESKREHATREMRDFDPQTNPDLINVLVDVLQNDAKASVRAEAAQSLGKLRPISQTVGWALEEATKDSSLRVRLQARSALMSYRISGYRSEPKVTETPAPKTAAAPAKTGFWPFSSIKSAASSQPLTPAHAVTTETAPPPLAESESSVTQPPAAAHGPARPKVAPSTPPGPQKPPAQPDAGPDLPPQ
jgi:HEAT repeats